MRFTATRLNSDNVRGITMDIKVLGPGCARCQAAEKSVKEAIKELGIDVNVEKINKIMEIAKFGVFATPAVVINRDVKCVGKVPTVEEVKNWITKETGKS